MSSSRDTEGESVLADVPFPPAKHRESVADDFSDADEGDALIGGGSRGRDRADSAEHVVLKYRVGTFVLNFVNAVLWFAIIVVPTEYEALQEDFQLGATHIAMIAMIRSIVMYGLSPVWGYLADTRKRSRIFWIAVMCWAGSTVVMAGARTYGGFIFATGLTGASMSAIVPITYSLLADYYPPTSIGSAFGWLGFSSVCGGMAGVVVPAVFAHLEYHHLAHWRIVFYLNAAAVVVAGFLSLALLTDPPRKASEPLSMRHMRHLTRNATFWIVVAQGFFGSLSWDVITFIMLWLGCMGLEPWQRSTVFALACVGAALGGLAGGLVGDWAHARYRRNGRILVSMGSVFVGVPLGVVFFGVIPTEPGSFVVLAGMATIFGFAISWPASACVLPIIAAVVPSSSIGTGYAIDRFVEGGSSAIGSLSVGLLAKSFGYHGREACNPKVASLESMEAEARKLGYAMAIVMVVPWIIYFVLFFPLLKTFPGDMARKEEEDRYRSEGPGAGDADDTIRDIDSDDGGRALFAGEESLAGDDDPEAVAAWKARVGPDDVTDGSNENPFAA